MKPVHPAHLYSLEYSHRGQARLSQVIIATLRNVANELYH